MVNRYSNEKGDRQTDLQRHRRKRDRRTDKYNPINKNRNTDSEKTDKQIDRNKETENYKQRQPREDRSMKANTEKEEKERNGK